MASTLARKTAIRYLANQKASEEQIHEWVDTFNRQGFLFLKNVLTPDWCSQLRAELDERLKDGEREDVNANLRLRTRLFETSDANLRLFDMEPIVSLAEALVAKNCHVIHNNSFIVKPGGGITSWHQDDAPHYLVTNGKPPRNVRLPVLFFTANYYLTDVPRIEYGGTEVIPRSHLLGQACTPTLDGTPFEKKIKYNLGNAGSVVMFNNQVWHRGGPNQSDRTRYITQVTYGRRMIGHKYFPFMNYTMPEHVYNDADPRRKRLLGFLESGAYG